MVRNTLYNFIIKFVSDLQQVGGFHRVLHQLNQRQRYNWNIVESGSKYHNPHRNPWLLTY
jgi:hypothetical protein